MDLIYGNKYIVKLECTVDNEVIEREVDIAWYLPVGNCYIDDFETVNDWDEGTGEWHIVGVMELPDINSDLWIPCKNKVIDTDNACPGDCDFCMYKRECRETRTGSIGNRATTAVCLMICKGGKHA